VLLLGIELGERGVAAGIVQGGVSGGIGQPELALGTPRVHRERFDAARSVRDGVSKTTGFETQKS
jgi:hypothetical protein